MRLAHLRFLYILLIPLVIISCSTTDDPTQPPPIEPETNPEIVGALDNYWGTSSNLSGSMTDLNGIVDQITTTLENVQKASLSERKNINDEITNYVNSFVNKTVEAGIHFDAMFALEENIKPYGSSNLYGVPADATFVQNMFTDSVGAVAKGIFNAGKKVVVSSGQMMRTSWRVLSGQMGLNQALQATDSGIPILSEMATRLKEHTAARDNRVVENILLSDTQEGYIPIAELVGNTPEEKANYFRNLSETNALKKQIRGDVHLWDTGERTETVRTIKKAATDQVKNYAGTVSGGDWQTEIGEQLLTTGQNPEKKGLLSQTVKKVDTLELVSKPKLMFIQKTKQPGDAPKMAIITNAPADLELELPEGDYNILVTAEDNVRSVAMDVEMVNDVTKEVVIPMYEVDEHSLIVEQVSMSQDIGVVGGVVSVNAASTSLLGRAITFKWEISGGAYTNLVSDGPRCSFKPSGVGDYRATVTATDDLGNSKSRSSDLVVVDVAIDVDSYEIASEEFSDEAINPGEEVGLKLSVQNTSGAAITGTLSASGSGGVTVTGQVTDVTIPYGSGQSYEFDVTASLPVDFSSSTMDIKVQFETTDSQMNQVVISDSYEFPVVFTAQINEITSPVSDRTLTVSGSVANPSLDSAHLIIDGEFDQAFVVALNNGAFYQDVAIEASATEVTHTVELIAYSGSWEASDTESFTSQIAPAGLRITLTWDTAETDVDLWVTDPNGEKCYYSNTSTASGLNFDFDDQNGYGPENITSESPINGNYLIQAHYWDDENPDGPNPTACTVIVRINEGTALEETYYYYGTLNESGDIWTATTFTIDGKSLQIGAGGSYSTFDVKDLPAK